MKPIRRTLTVGIMWDGKVSLNVRQKKLKPSELIRKYDAVYAGLELMFCANETLNMLTKLYRAYANEHELEVSTIRNWSHNNKWGVKLLAARKLAFSATHEKAPNFSAAKWA